MSGRDIWDSSLWRGHPPERTVESNPPIHRPRITEPSSRPLDSDHMHRGPADASYLPGFTFTERLVLTLVHLALTAVLITGLRRIVDRPDRPT